jgi:hypothetical protein
MALHLNLLHEEILEQRQRKRDPLKLGVMALCGFGALMALYYMWNGYRTLEIKGRLSAVQQDWAKVEPKVTAAQKKSEELNGVINTTRVLDAMIESRFYWAPFLGRVAQCVAPNAKLTSLDGNVEVVKDKDNKENKVVNVLIEGEAAGREARGAAEDLRQLLIEQLGKSYADVKVEFKTLEDLDTVANIGGVSMPMARYILSVNFKPLDPKEATPTRKPKQ